MPSVCLYFHVHQPLRLKKYDLFESSEKNLGETYFDYELNKHYFLNTAKTCYLPANKLVKKLIEETSGEFKASYSISGVFLDQCLAFDENVLQSFQELVDTKCVELIDETYFHSLASLYADLTEFREQVRLHKQKIKELFGVEPKAFRNTELLYNDRIAREVASMGYKTVLSEGIERVLDWRSSNYVYHAKELPELKLLLRNYKLSDDVGFRFSNKGWEEWPLTAAKYASWLSACSGQTINLFMDYETFGEHHWRDSGIFEFLEGFPHEVLKHENLSFKTVSETSEENNSLGEISVASDLSWADLERDSSAWLGNKMQWACFHELQKLNELLQNEEGSEAQRIWRLLQTSDHFMYACTKSWEDGDVHKHFSPYKQNTPHQNYANYMNILIDFKHALEKKIKVRNKWL